MEDLDERRVKINVKIVDPSTTKARRPADWPAWELGSVCFQSSSMDEQALGTVADALREHQTKGTDKLARELSALDIGSIGIWNDSRYTKGVVYVQPLGFSEYVKGVMTEAGKKGFTPQITIYLSRLIPRAEPSAGTTAAPAGLSPAAASAREQHHQIKVAGASKAPRKPSPALPATAYTQTSAGDMPAGDQY